MSNVQGGGQQQQQQGDSQQQQGGNQQQQGYPNYYGQQQGYGGYYQQGSPYQQAWSQQQQTWSPQPQQQRLSGSGVQGSGQQQGGNQQQQVDNQQQQGGSQQQQGGSQQQQGGSQQQQGKNSQSTSSSSPAPPQSDHFDLKHFDNDHGPSKDKADWTLQSPRMLQIKVKGRIWIQRGSMKAYTGNIKFTRENITNGGIGKMIKRAIANEHIFLTKAEGDGVLFLGEQGKSIQIIHLKNETLCVNGHKVLAFENSLKWDITLMKTFAGVIEGGYFNVTFSGSGSIAISTWYEPLTLEVNKGQSVCTDPHATIAWSGHLYPSVKIDSTIKTYYGRGSGETVQMQFTGDSGFVCIQPMEEFHLSQQG